MDRKKTSCFTTYDTSMMLTFDDGPSAQHTGRLLSLLREHNVKAGFFTVAKFALQNPGLISKMAEDGHEIGIHSFSHKSAYLMTPSQAAKDLDKSYKALLSLGIEAKFFRPPWGHTTEALMKAAACCNLSPVYWNVMAEDWKSRITSSEIAIRLLKRTTPGSIVCLHDGRGRNNAPLRTIEALSLVLPIWKDLGYRFATPSEVFGNE